MKKLKKIVKLVVIYALTTGYCFRIFFCSYNRTMKGGRRNDGGNL